MEFGTEDVARKGQDDGEGEDVADSEGSEWRLGCHRVTYPASAGPWVSRIVDAPWITLMHRTSTEVQLLLRFLHRLQHSHHEIMHPRNQ